MAPVRNKSVSSGEKSAQWQCESAAGQLLSNFVSAGVVAEEETSHQDSVFSPHLYEAEKHMQAKRELEQLGLQLELLQQEQQSADVTHSFHLARRFQEFEKLNDHLQQILRNRNSLRERLMKNDTADNLPVPSHLHRSVVEVLDLILDFIENLEDKIGSAHCQTSVNECLSQINCSMDKLSYLSVQIDNLATQLLERKVPDHHHPHSVDES